MEETVPINLTSPDRNVPRRKSSIFNRRSTYVDDGENMQCSASSSEMLGRPERLSDFHVETYIKCLKKEVEEWERMYKERKQARTLTRKLYRLNNVLTEQDAFAVFNEEDNKFVEGRKDYDGIGREAVVAMEKLSIALQKAINVEKSSQLLLNHLQKTETELRKQIVEFSFLE